MPTALDIVGAVAPTAGQAGVAVPLRLPASAVVASYAPDLDEHARRAESGCGPVVSASELSDLWELPGGLPVRSTAIPLANRDVFRARGLVRDLPGGLIQREFEPCGSVTALFAVDRSADAALRRASLLSPIYKRYAVIADPAPEGRRERIFDDAERCGIGVVFVGDDPDSCLPAPPAVLGRPHVYRWWMSEMAYSSWLQIRAVPRS